MSFARPALLAYSFLSNQRTWLGFRGFALLGLLDFLFRINSCYLLGSALRCLAGFTFSSELTPSARVVYLTFFVLGGFVFSLAWLAWTCLDFCLPFDFLFGINLLGLFALLGLALFCFAWPCLSLLGFVLFDFALLGLAWLCLA